MIFFNLRYGLRACQLHAINLAARAARGARRRAVRSVGAAAR